MCLSMHSHTRTHTFILYRHTHTLIYKHYMHMHMWALTHVHKHTTLSSVQHISPKLCSWKLLILTTWQEIVRSYNYLCGHLPQPSCKSSFIAANVAVATAFWTLDLPLSLTLRAWSPSCLASRILLLSFPPPASTSSMLYLLLLHPGPHFPAHVYQQAPASPSCAVHSIITHWDTLSCLYAESVLDIRGGLIELLGHESWLST